MKDKIIAFVFVVVMMMMSVSAYAQIAADEFHDKNELKKLQGYCFEHAVRAANGEAVVNDLIRAGLIDSQYYNMTCSNIEQLLRTCTEAFTQKFGREPYYDYEFSICPKIENKNKDKNVGPLENFTRAAQNGTQYTCQEGSSGQVLGCSPISNNTTQQIEQAHNKVGTLMKHEGEVYCYDETTTSKKDVIDAIKNDWIDQQTEFNNDLFSGMVEDGDGQYAEQACKGIIENGLNSKESYLDKPLELEGTLTLE